MDCKPGGGIDLHVHSTASDGTLTPPEIIELASRNGLEAIAITDHDTLAGTREALAGSIPTHLKFITGIEISASSPADGPVKGSLHVLGYGIDPVDTRLGQVLEQFNQIRDNRIVRIVDRLQELGVPLTVEQVTDEVGEGTAGRPHVAKAMIRAGFATDINDAFDRYLADDGPAYVGKERVSCRKAFELIHGAGGVPVLAHPYLAKCPDAGSLRKLVSMLCDMGLMGMEVYYPRHTPEATAQYLAMAKAFNLLITGGSDFHGSVTPDIQLGRGSGSLHVPYALFEALLSSRSALCVR